jgi:hypothetical protein
MATTFISIDVPEELYKRIRRWMRYRRELAGFVIDVLCVLVAERATGCMRINLNQGVAQSIEFEQRSDQIDLPAELA